MTHLDYDLLLTFLSEKGRGTWTDFKSAHQWLAEPTTDPTTRAWITARDLAALGHIEVAWGDRNQWCAAPPIITILPRSGGRAFVTGARTRYLYHGNISPSPTRQPSGHMGGTGQLVRACDQLNLWLDECETFNGPHTLLIACQDHTDAEHLANQLGIRCTYNVADQIAGLLPPLESYAAHFQQGALPQGFEAEYFDPALAAWLPAGSLEQRGLYRCRTYEGHVYALLDATSIWRRVVREFGVYEVFRWEQRPVISYSLARSELHIPAEAALPALHARAATLCSGRLPRWRLDSDTDAYRLTYANVSLNVAERIASSLNQELMEV
jgi:hypothetical protein